MDDPFVHVIIYSESNSFVVFDVFVVEQHEYDVQTNDRRDKCFFLFLGDTSIDFFHDGFLRFDIVYSLYVNAHYFPLCILHFVSEGNFIYFR
jgi:hypothetical protein